MELPPVIRCILTAYFIKYVTLSLKCKEDLCLQTLVILLDGSGYNWARYFLLTSVECLEINEWVLCCLSFLRDGQQCLVHKINLYGVKRNLTIKEQHLLYIIESNFGITSSRIGIKLGKSDVTVRRMLAKLRRLNLIRTSGVGSNTCHILM